MFQTDQASAVPALPAPGAAATQGFFTNGNPGTGQAATVVDADFLNMMMMELTNVVTATGLTPSKTIYTQLLQSIRILCQAVAGSANYGTDTGVINAYAATFPAPILTVNDGMSLSFKAAHANTAASTFSPNPGVIAPAPVWGGNNAALVGGEIIVGFTTVVYSVVFGAWILLEDPGGAKQMGAGTYGVSPPSGDRSKKLVTAEWVQRNYKPGEVKMWHGAVASIAAVWGPGWQLADGTNGTASLKDRFVVGAGLTYAVNQTGGATSVTLAIGNMPAHNHVINIGDPTHSHAVADPTHAHAIYDPSHNHGLPQSPHAHSVSDPSHSHSLQYLGSAQAGDDNGGAATSSPTGFSTGRGIAGTAGAFTGIGIQAQYANISINAAVTGIATYGVGTGIALYAAATGISASSNNAGSGAAFDPRPPFYALCYIEYTGIGA